MINFIQISIKTINLKEINFHRNLVKFKDYLLNNLVKFKDNLHNNNQNKFL